MDLTNEHFNFLNPQKNSNKNFKLIQVLRGIAAMLVVLFHLSGTLFFKLDLQYLYLSTPFQLGWVGVDFFFILSGFIITYVHAQDVGHRDRIKLFLQKRLIRIFPIYWLVLLVVITLRLGLPGMTSDNRFDVGVFLKSLVLWPQKEPVIHISWTLSHELFFYLVFSLLILLKPKISVSIIGLWLSGILINLTGLLDPIIQKNQLLDLALCPINLEFVAGCMVAYLVLNYQPKYGKFFFYSGISLLILAAPFYIRNNAAIYDPHSFLRLISLGLPILLIILGAVLIELKNSIKTFGLLDQIGDASYSIYLSHSPILSILIAIALKFHISEKLNPPLDALILMPTIFLITIATGLLLYSYVEKPMLSRLKRSLKGGKSTNFASNTSHH